MQFIGELNQFQTGEQSMKTKVGDKFKRTLDGAVFMVNELVSAKKKPQSVVEGIDHRAWREPSAILLSGTHGAWRALRESLEVGSTWERVISDKAEVVPPAEKEQPNEAGSPLTRGRGLKLELEKIRGECLKLGVELATERVNLKKAIENCRKERAANRDLRNKLAEEVGYVEFCSHWHGQNGVGGRGERV